MDVLTRYDKAMCIKSVPTTKGRYMKLLKGQIGIVNNKVLKYKDGVQVVDLLVPFRKTLLLNIPVTHLKKIAPNNG